jgi:hypothetical protein
VTLFPKSDSCVNDIFHPVDSSIRFLNDRAFRIRGGKRNASYVIPSIHVQTTSPVPARTLRYLFGFNTATQSAVLGGVRQILGAS